MTTPTNQPDIAHIIAEWRRHKANAQDHDGKDRITAEMDLETFAIHNVDALVAEVERLQQRVRELEEDKATLDWLAENHVAFAEELHRIGWKAPNDAQWHKLEFFLRRLRFAVSEARADAAQKGDA